MSRIPTKFEGHVYKTGEHAYLTAQAVCYGLTKVAGMWKKVEGIHEFEKKKYDVSDPRQVKRWARILFRPFRENSKSPQRIKWLSTRCEVMLRIVLAKFKGHPEARQMLLETRHALLVEESLVDRF